ncbi:hypothetical protein Egran_06240 [Elaphomyces granulatus]|uniref:Iron-sulfur cluster assembly protein n=1 Tax=Elaphomyces granulatus TaxID=519963 RepID=A0A232LPE1_9EURO|nr:hypothetical protein Egran_06240 [Elaphomyces granulatus]
MLSIRTAGRMAKSPSLKTLASRRYHEKDMCSPPQGSYLFFVLQANLHKLIDHYMNPRNVGSLNRKDTSVGTGLVGAPACGDVIRLDIQVDEATGTIVDTRFKTFGCGSAIASSSYLTTLIKGKPLDEAAKIKNTDIAAELCLPPVKLHCSLLAEDAIKAAIANYQSKRVGAAATNLAQTSKAFAKETDGFEVIQ